MSSSHLFPSLGMALLYNIDIINIYYSIFYFDYLIISYRVSRMNKTLLTAFCLMLVSASLPAHAAKVKCSDFKSQKEAQAYFDAKKPGYKGLDRDNDGIACEALK